MFLCEWNKTTLPRKRNRLLFGMIVVLFCVIYSGILATKSMAPTEGWYSYYAYIMNEEGAVPYLDFELLFPPLYVYIIALFTRVFGYSIIALRILGVVVYALTGLFAYLIFEKLTSKPVFSVFAGLLAISVLQSESVQIFYDYIRFMDLAVYAAIYFFICTIDTIDKTGKIKFYDPNLILGAVFTTFASMFKQSSGFIYCVVFLAFAFLVFKNKMLYLKAFGIFFGVVAFLYVIMALFLVQQGSFSSYIYYNFKAAVAAKGGSLVAVLFGWLIRSKSQMWLFALGTLGVALIFGLLWFLKYLSHRYPASEEDKKPRASLFVILFCVIFGVLFTVASLLFDNSFWNNLLIGSHKMFTAFLVSTVAFAVVAITAIIYRIRKKELPEGTPAFCFISGAVFVLAYSVCTSGGLVESQVALGYPLFAMLFLPSLKFKKHEWVALGLAIAMLFNTGLGFERKLRRIYNWWGLDVGSISDQTETTNVPLLAGIKVNKAYARMYNGVLKSVEKHSEKGDEIFVFPHMPVLYLMCDRPRATNTANQWFDVSTDAAVIADIDVIKEKKPKVMVLCMIDEYVVNSHESSFRQGTKSGLHEMQDFLKDFVIEEGYIIDGFFTISSGYTVAVWYLP